jgi:hypothetical protein
MAGQEDRLAAPEFAINRHLPHSPGRRVAAPHFVELLHFPESVHALPETFVLIDR